MFIQDTFWCCEKVCQILFKYYRIQYKCYITLEIKLVLQLQNLKSHPLPLQKEFFDNNQSVQSSGLFIDSRQIIKRLTLPRGKYVVIPCTWGSNEEAGFYLRFFFENQNTAEYVCINHLICPFVVFLLHNI